MPTPPNPPRRLRLLHQTEGQGVSDVAFIAADSIRLQVYFHETERCILPASALAARYMLYASATTCNSARTPWQSNPEPLSSHLRADSPTFAPLPKIGAHLGRRKIVLTRILEVHLYFPDRSLSFFPYPLVSLVHLSPSRLPATPRAPDQPPRPCSSARLACEFCRRLASRTCIPGR